MATQEIVVEVKVEGAQTLEKLGTTMAEVGTTGAQASTQIEKVTKTVKAGGAAAAATSPTFDLMASSIALVASTSSQSNKHMKAIAVGLATLADKADEATAALKKTSKGVGKAGKQAKAAGKASEQASKKVADLGTLFSRMGGTGASAGFALESLAVTMTGPVGLAIGAVVVATGGLILTFKAVTGAVSATSSAILQYAENNTVLQKASAATSSALDTLIETFGAAVIGGEGFADMLDFVAKEFRSMTKFISDNAGTIFKTAKTIASGILSMIKATVGGISLLVGGMLFPFDLALAGLNQFRRTGLEVVRAVIAETGPLLVQLGVMTQGGLERQLRFVDATLAEIKPRGLAISKSLSAATVGLIDKLTEAQNKLNALQMGALGVGTGRKKTKRRRAGGAPPPPGEAAPDLVLPGEGLAPGRRSSFAETQDEDLKVLRAYNEALDVAQTKAVAAGTIFKELGGNIKTELVGGFVDLTASLGGFLGAFAAGTATLSEFGDAVADMMGGLASTMGRFFIEAGAAFLAGGFVGQGIGMIAAGTALSALGGLLGGVGSGNKGSGAGAGSAASGAASTVAREVQRSLRGPVDSRTNQTIEIVIAGRSIEPEMVNIIDDVVRLGRSRQLARRGV